MSALNAWSFGVHFAALIIIAMVIRKLSVPARVTIMLTPIVLLITLCNGDGSHCTEAIYKTFTSKQECEYQITDQRIFNASCLQMEKHIIN